MTARDVVRTGNGALRILIELADVNHNRVPIVQPPLQLVDIDLFDPLLHLCDQAITGDI